MEWKSYFNNVFKGVIGAISITILLTAVFSLIMTFVDFSDAVFSGIYVGITSVSLILGTIIASKLQGHRG